METQWLGGKAKDGRELFKTAPPIPACAQPGSVGKAMDTMDTIDTVNGNSPSVLDLAYVAC